MSRRTARTARSTFGRKLRAHRNNREFDRALRSASPSMQQELLAAAARSIDLAR